ncbi:DUF4145 domain-containing protein, partial [Acinetobacter seifertii]|uniref:DUF4145 domain-containing protein n=3 Tax=Acinetobacter TaxID=469 RepID=UPI000D4150FE
LLISISSQIYQNFDKETERLLKSRNYNLALITGYISFEKSLREYYKNTRFIQPKIHSMLLKDELINNEQASLLDEARLLRNRIIHGDENIKLTKEQVNKFLETLKLVQEKLKSN